jgi:hypothetical protein
MDSDSEDSSSGPPWSPSSSEGGDRGNSNATAPPRSASYEPNSCQQTNLNAEFDQPAAYLVGMKAPKALQGVWASFRWPGASSLIFSERSLRFSD